MGVTFMDQNGGRRNEMTKTLERQQFSILFELAVSEVPLSSYDLAKKLDCPIRAVQRRLKELYADHSVKRVTKWYGKSSHTWIYSIRFIRRQG